MAHPASILEGCSDKEKGAYLGAIASLATADRQASIEEREHLAQLCAAANLSPQQTSAVQQAASSLMGEELRQCLDVLKNSQLRFSLIADLIAFAKADADYSEAEEQNIRKISQHLGVDPQQHSLLNEVAQQPAPSPLGAEPASSPQAFLGGGLKEKLQGAGIDTGSLMKGLLAVAAPMLLSRMLSRGHSGPGGGLGGMLRGGGLGSLIGMLSGGRGMRGTGGLLGKILGGRF